MSPPRILQPVTFSGGFLRPTLVERLLRHVPISSEHSGWNNSYQCDLNRSPIAVVPMRQC